MPRRMNPVAAGLTAAAFTGLVSGVITRALMRVVKVLINGTPGFDLAGSLFIPVFYVIMLAPGAVALAFKRAWWSWLLLAGGAVLLIEQAITIGILETLDSENMTTLRWVLLVLTLLAMAATYGLQVLYTVRLSFSLSNRHAWSTGYFACSRRDVERRCK
jgi:hypothetical protein